MTGAAGARTVPETGSAGSGSGGGGVPGGNGNGGSSGGNAGGTGGESVGGAVGSGGAGASGVGGGSGGAAGLGFGGTAGHGSGGTAGRGSGGTAGHGSGGTAGHGAGGTAGSGGTAPTFTTIYSSILVVHCAGSNCHKPGMQGGIGFGTQASAYSAISLQVRPGDGADSDFYVTVNTGVMPKGGPKLSAANLSSIKAWIDAGALNN
jgi:hypothetical protein